MPLLVEEDSSPRLELLFRDEQSAAVWWATEVECASAVSRLERVGQLDPAAADLAFQALSKLAAMWHTIDPVELIRVTARRFLRVHDLRAADALQLAAGFVAAEGRPTSLDFVCLDDHLVMAARKEGFRVIDQAGL